MNVALIDDGLNESQPEGSIPDFEQELLTVEDFGREEPVESDVLDTADGVL
jgi:hypothetical protein